MMPRHHGLDVLLVDGLVGLEVLDPAGRERL
jgi:hypothetical protein